MMFYAVVDSMYERFFKGLALPFAQLQLINKLAVFLQTLTALD